MVLGLDAFDYVP